MTITNKEKNDKLHTDIQIIKNIILANFKDLLFSIVLYGSYGRNEGAFFKKDNKIFVYNDYDLLLVVEKVIPKILLNNLKKDILKLINIKWIDISQINIINLKKLKPTIFNYDLKYGSDIIYGDQNILMNIRNILPSDITLVDAEKLFFTRLYTFFGSLKGTAFIEGVAGEESRFFRNQMAKAVLAIVDIILLQNKVYDSSYIKRNKLVKDVISPNDDLVELFDWALSEKISPRAVIMDKNELNIFYKKIISLYFMHMMKALSILYKTTIANTDDLILAKKYSGRVLLKKFKVLIVCGSLKSYNKQHIVNIAQSYIGESFFLNNKSQEKSIEKCLNLLEPLNITCVQDKPDWNEMRLMISKLRIN